MGCKRLSRILYSISLISMGIAFLVPKSLNNYWLIFDFMFYFGILLAIIGTIYLYSTLRYSDYNKCDSKYRKIYKQKLILIDNDKKILRLIFDQSTSMYWLKILYPFDIDFGDLLAKKDIASIINYLKEKKYYIEDKRKFQEVLEVFFINHKASLDRWKQYKGQEVVDVRNQSNVWKYIFYIIPAGVTVYLIYKLFIL